MIIKKSITIDGTGVPASIIAGQATAITIDIPFRRIGPDPKRSVRIRGLAINGLGTGMNGINVVAARQVTIEDCVIDGFNADGIILQTGTLFVNNTSIRNNGAFGVNVLGSSTAAISDSRLIFNGTGLTGNVTKYCCVVLYGNKNGDPAPPSP